MADNELDLYITNDGELYEKYTKPIYQKLADAMAGGTYSHAKAVKEFMALADVGAKKYQKEIERRRFTDEEKRDYAESAVDYFETEWSLGNLREHAREAMQWNPSPIPMLGEAKDNPSPKYSEKRGWTGGDSRTLYAITDRRTGNVTVRPGGGRLGVGPEADIRVATRTEAEEHWQDPLHPGWTVVETDPLPSRNPPNVLPVPGQAIRSWDHGDGYLVRICEEGTDGSYNATIRIADGNEVSVPLKRTEYDLLPRKLLERRTGFSRHEQFVGRPQLERPERTARGTPMDPEDITPFPEGATTLFSSERKNPRRWTASEVQSLLFDAEHWTVAQAKKWAKDHDFKYGDIDTTDAYHHLRQFAPVRGRPCRTVTFEHDARGVIKARVCSR